MKMKEWTNLTHTDFHIAIWHAFTLKVEFELKITYVKYHVPYVPFMIENQNILITY